MLASLFAILLASAQPAPAEEPVVTDTAVEVDVQTDAAVETPVADAEVQATTTAAAEVEAPPAAPEEEVICRRRLVPNEGIGRRHRVVRDCRPASEWPASRRRTRGGD